MSEQLSTEKRTAPAEKKNISCVSCGKQIAATARFCNFCGKEQKLTGLPSEKNPSEALSKEEVLVIIGQKEQSAKTLAQIAAFLPYLSAKEDLEFLGQINNKHLLSFVLTHLKDSRTPAEYQQVMAAYLAVGADKLDLLLAAGPFLNEALVEVFLTAIAASAPEFKFWRLLKLQQLIARDKVKTARDNLLSLLTEAERPEFILMADK